MTSWSTIESFRLDGKVSLVTGASRGLGKAIAEALAGAGSDVVLTGRQMKTLLPVADAIREKTGRKVLPVEMDMGMLPSITAAVDSALKEFGCLDILVNNAAINIRMPAVEYTEEATISQVCILRF